jgi:Yip1 domain
MRSSYLNRLFRLVLQPADAWTEIASESGQPASLLLPLPALLVALGPVFFVIGHGFVGGGGSTIALGSSLGWAMVYYALLVLCLFGQAQLLSRFGPALGIRVNTEDALKLSVYASIPFLLSGLALFTAVEGWESVVVVAGMIGQGLGAVLLYQGLGVLTRAESRVRGLLAMAAAGGTITAWVLGFFLLNKIIL